MSQSNYAFEERARLIDQGRTQVLDELKRELLDSHEYDKSVPKSHINAFVERARARS